MSKIRNTSFFRGFAHTNFFGERPLAAILNFDDGSIFKKAIAHPHAARNVMSNLKKMNKIFFF